MQYGRHFKPGQKIFLHALPPTGDPQGCFDSLTTYLKEIGPGWFDLSLPYQSKAGEDFPFATGMRFELRSESLGLGLRLTGQFVQHRGRDTIRLALDGDLRAYQNRQSPRLDTVAGVRYTRGHGSLRSFRDQWEKNIQILQGNSADQLGNFPRTPINLSNGGIRFSLRAPVEPGSLCLLLLELEPGTVPLCALTEVLWTGDVQEERQKAGMRFLTILETDRKRIDNFIRKRLAAPPAV
ncbi:MAG: PilZ domain-containing protein [Desulfuromonadales bacterium]|nr:PilZ domain-containing protein [Desulfuromonadales bacterium]